MRSESLRRSFDPKRARPRSREAGRAITVVLAVLALAAVGGLALTLMEMATPLKIEQARERAPDGSWQAVAIEEGARDPRSTSSARESRRTTRGSAPASEDRAFREERSDDEPATSVATREEVSRPIRRPRPREIGTYRDRNTPGSGRRDDPRLVISNMGSESVAESVAEEVSDDPVTKGDIFERDFAYDAADNWGYDELPPRFADQAGLEEGFLIVGFDGEFVHGPEALQSKASRPDQPNPAPIDLWNPWTGEQTTVMIPLDSLRFSESPP